ncbi:hypothetical protein COM08_24650 [Bacillus wiedmannii]|uniref:Uncharacterized protein n=1 Tax=Bacillus wiedmannii TaxID=1890302 RepID=A0A2B5IKV0_9BACI|nr:hypothetical protein COL51_16880 [Bacillus wiedmannii]PGC14676.1 hypothetical protein COM08_24650 [Bacillus wiedmannii]PGC49432.1 hypothetical protein COM22_29780 [Bacillus wiedmannii]PGD30295.1 hypothetical protein COM27_25175 [Bacillus wiedmannii]PHE76571.1 hypothetical protein COF77_11035 [Bacillus wiedmannii]
MFISNILTINVSFGNVEKQNKGCEISTCAKCKKQSLRVTYKEHLKKWVRFCLCCDYKEMNPANILIEISF